MTNRVTYSPQDFQKMCKQAERDHEAKKLVVLMERVKRQIAAQEEATTQTDAPKRPVTAMPANSRLSRPRDRSASFER